MRGNLPNIKWESTKWIEDAATEETKESKNEDKGTTRVVKTSKKGAKKNQHLDVFDRSAESRKPVLLYFTMEKSKLCRTMEKLLLRQKSVTNAAKKYHCIMLVKDFITKDIAEKYKIKVAPTVVLADHTGKKFIRLAGRQTPEALAEIMKRFAKENAKAAKEKAEAPKKTGKS